MALPRGLLAVLAVLALCFTPSSAATSRPIPYVRRTASARPLSSQLAGHAGSDRAGADMLDTPMRLKRNAPPSDCAQACLKTEGCVAWSYDPADGSCETPHTSSRSPSCYLKSSISPVAAHSCRTSGTPYAALQPPAFPKLPATAVKPTGWLAQQLQVQAAGLAGHLQLFWEEVADSEFIGGKHDTPEHNHERFAYWLNGMVTVGYYNEDAAITANVYNYTSYLLDHQRADGWLGPAENYDPWPRMLLLYIFQQYNEINGTDTRVVPAMYKYLNFLWNQYNDPKYNPEQNMWTYVRIEDMQTSIFWLYDNHPQDQQQFLLDLSEYIYTRSWDWKNYYANRFPTGDIGHSWNYYDHGVNNGMALKSAAIQWRASNDPSDIESTYVRMHKMDMYHGQASGIFSCDECLAGLNPSRGTELCTVVEAMFSYAHIFSILGDPVFADKVEQMTFNALPATITADMWAHQYLQQSNEINAVVQDDPWWNTDGGDSNLYGLEPNYGCCTANMPQGYPKYLQAQWLLTQNATSTGVLAAFLGPSEVSVTVEDPTFGNNTIHIASVTDYPLVPNATIQYAIKADHPFGFAIRIPGWAVGALLVDQDGKHVRVANGTIYTYEYSNTADTVVIYLSLPYSLRAVRRFNNAVSIYYGPLLMALDFSYNTTVLHRYAYESVDLQYLPIDKWNYAILIDDANPAAYLNVTAGEGVPKQYPWDPMHPTVRISAWAREIDWPMKHDSADEPPMSPVKSNKPLVPITLVPYGQTKLRIAEIPVLAQ